MVGYFAIATGTLGVALGFAWASSGDRSLGVCVWSSVAAGIGGAALGAVAGFCFFVARM
jgi:hypothetical protein